MIGQNSAHSSGSGATSDAAVAPSKNETSHQRRKTNFKSPKQPTHANLSHRPLPLSPAAAAAAASVVSRGPHSLADRKHSALTVAAHSADYSTCTQHVGAFDRSTPTSTSQRAGAPVDRHSASPSPSSSTLVSPETLDSESVNSVTQSLHALLSAMDRLVLNEYILSKAAAASTSAAVPSNQSLSQPPLSSEEFEQRARRLVESAKSFGSANGSAAAPDSAPRSTPSPRPSPEKATTESSAGSAAETRSGPPVRRAHSSVTAPIPVAPAAAALQSPNQLPAMLQLPIASNVSSLLDLSSGGGSSSQSRTSPNQPIALAAATSCSSNSSLNSNSAGAQHSNTGAPLGCAACSAVASNKSAFGVPLQSTISPNEMKSEIEELARKIKSLAQGFRRLSENGDRESSPEQAAADSSDPRSPKNLSIDKITIDSVDHGTILSPGIVPTPGSVPQPPDSAGKDIVAFNFVPSAEAAASANTSNQISPTQTPSLINIPIERSVQSVQEPVKEMEKTVQEEIVGTRARLDSPLQYSTLRNQKS